MSRIVSVEYIAILAWSSKVVMSGFLSRLSFDTIFISCLGVGCNPQVKKKKKGGRFLDRPSGMRFRYVLGNPFAS